MDSHAESKNLDDLRFLPEKMEASEENFRDVEIEDEDLEVLKVSVRRFCGRYSALRQSLLQRT